MATNTPTMGLVKPDTNDKTEDTIVALADNFERLDKALSWVGMIIQSTRLIVPSEIYGGTWTPLQGRMLVGAGTDFPAGTTGGAKEHELALGEMPFHAHGVSIRADWGSDNGQNVGCSVIEGRSIYSGADTESATNKAVGGGKAHNNMPPYKAVYMWERTA